MRRLVAILVMCAVLGGGSYGAWSYARSYIVYRGFEPPRTPAGMPAGKLLTRHFWSPSMQQRRAYRIYLPPGYRAAAARGVRFPVMYLLHGAPGWPDQFVNVAAVTVASDVLLARHAMQPMLIVMVDGRNGTFRSETEWANTTLGNFESLVLDVVKTVDSHYSTARNRLHRAIGGNSEGGYGAMNIALRHLGTFSVAESWSGYFTQSYTNSPFKHASFLKLRANSPSSYVLAMRPQIARQPFRALIYSGQRDPSRKLAAPFAARLRAAGGQVTFGLHGGRHDWGLWRAQTPMSLRFAAASMGPRV
jgi:enterochelin esterase-like enzyme